MITTVYVVDICVLIFVVYTINYKPKLENIDKKISGSRSRKCNTNSKTYEKLLSAIYFNVDFRSCKLNLEFNIVRIKFKLQICNNYKQTPSNFRNNLIMCHDQFKNVNINRAT